MHYLVIHFNQTFMDREIYDKVVSLLSKNQKIAAVKLLCDTRKYGLKEAKDMVDEIEKNLPKK
ncbi:MAG: hypothetical protein Fur004_28070 [Thermoflexibacter sp.]